MKFTSALHLAALLASAACPFVVAQKNPDGFSQLLPSDIRWTPSKIVRGGRTAILLGDPEKPGPLVIRVKLPPQSKITLHTHPDVRTYAVLSGEWKLGFADRFDPAALKTFPAGSIYRLPAGVVRSGDWLPGNRRADRINRSNSDRLSVATLIEAIALVYSEHQGSGSLYAHYA